MIEIPAFLTPADVKQLTGKVRGAEQAEQLNRMGIEFKKRPTDGEVVVSRLHVERVLGGLPKTVNKKDIGPNFNRI